MNSSTTSQYMDKQIMDLSNSQSFAHNNSGGNSDFIDFMSRPPAEKKDDIVPSYDFMPIRPAVGSSSPTAARPTSFDSGNEGAPTRNWNSVGSHVFSVRTYRSPDADEPETFDLGRNHDSSDVPFDESLISEIDRTMKKHMGNLMHAVDKISARLSQLETRTRDIESSIDDLKVIVENNHGKTDGKMRVLENVLTEVLMGVQFVKDKHEIFEAQLQIAKLQVPKSEHVETKSTSNLGPTQITGVSSHQHNTSLTQPPTPNLPPPNAPPQHSSQIPNPFPHNQVPPIPQQDPYFNVPSQNSENPSQQYQNPPPHHNQQQLTASPPPHQYNPPPQPHYSHPPPPPSQTHPSFTPVNPSSLSQPPIGHSPEEPSYMSSQTYSQSIRPPSGQYYGPSPFEPPSSRIGPGPGHSGSFGLSSGHGELYPYNSGSPVKSQQVTSAGMGQSGYPQLPTARILPQSLPTASAVGGGSGSGSGSGNRVPIDDVVDRVTNMGFSRDQVRETVRKLTENGQAVDLNVVLDKLMNDGGEGQGRGWFGR